MNIKCLSLGTMKSNCYLVWGNGDAVVIDPGDDAEFIISTLNELELTPKAIIATHGHFDHVMAVLELKLAYKISFYMHEKDSFLLKRMRESAKHFMGFDPGPAPKIDVYLKDNSKLKIENCELKIVSTPGHTPGSVSLYSKANNALFVGDLIFADGLTGRVDFSYSNKTRLEKSIEKIMKLPENTIVYPGHGDKFTLRKKMLQQVRLQTD